MSALVFTPYPKISDGLDLPEKVTYVCQEKLHGANLSLITDGDDVQAAKRRELLAADENFFGARYRLPSLRAQARLAFAFLSGERPGLKAVQIYGELVGGAYPGLPGGDLSRPVQSAVAYAPDLVFVPFDVLADGKLWLAADTVGTMAAAAGWCSAPELSRGGWRAVLNTPLPSAPQLPGRLGLPAVAGNLAEGWVIKPAEDWLGMQRPMLKRKRAEFSETQDKPSALSAGAFDYWFGEAQRRINANRLIAAASKVGTEDEDAVLAEAWRDILAELEGVDDATRVRLTALLADTLRLQLRLLGVSAPS